MDNHVKIRLVTISGLSTQEIVASRLKQDMVRKSQRGIRATTVPKRKGRSSVGCGCAIVEGGQCAAGESSCFCTYKYAINGRMVLVLVVEGNIPSQKYKGINSTEVLAGVHKY